MMTTFSGEGFVPALIQLGGAMKATAEDDSIERQRGEARHSVRQRRKTNKQIIAESIATDRNFK